MRNFIFSREELVELDKAVQKIFSAAAENPEKESPDKTGETPDEKVPEEIISPAFTKTNIKKVSQISEGGVSQLVKRKLPTAVPSAQKTIASKTVAGFLEELAQKHSKELFEILMLREKDKQFQKQLAMGIEVEHEHTSDNRIAKKIAMDHLKEDPIYYTKLNKAGL